MTITLERDVYLDPRLFKLARLVKEWTGCDVKLSSLSVVLWDPGDGLVHITEAFAVECLLHELCHYIAATPRERGLLNLDMVNGPWISWRELVTSGLEVWLARRARFDLKNETHGGADLALDNLEGQKHPDKYYIWKGFEALARFERDHPGAGKRIIRALTKEKDERR